MRGYNRDSKTDSIGNKTKINKRGINMQNVMQKILGAMIVTFLVAGMMLAPIVSAKTEKTKDWNNPEIVKEEVDKLAKASSKADFDKQFDSLPSAGQSAVIKHLKEGRLEVKSEISTTSTPQSGMSISALVTRCKAVTYTATWKSYLGYKYWDYFERVDWCYDGSKITNNPTASAWGVVYFPGWFFDGNIGPIVKYGGLNQNYFEARAQGRFKLCISSYGCIVEKNPWIDTTVYGTGSYKASIGG
jgi:preprotein translocase subunit SecG